MNVFVLCTGRCGSLTFTRACQHLCNYTAGHETLSKCYGCERFAYPDQHIEADNRLSWFLGQLGSRFDEREVFYVHLRRDPEAVALSHLHRWNNDPSFRASIIRAFGYGIVKQTQDWPNQERIAVCRAYVDSVTANVDEFLRHRPSMTMWLEEAEDAFPVFLDRIGAQGDLERAQAEWTTVHNASTGAGPTGAESRPRRLDDSVVRQSSSRDLIRVIGRRVRKRMNGAIGRK